MKKLLAMMILLLCALPLYSQGHNTQSIYYVNTQDTSTGNALKIWKNVQAKPFNAIANGSTDNRAAIQATFTAAGSNSTVIFPPGNYHTSDSILIAGSNVTVDGPGATIQQTTAGKKIFKVTKNVMPTLIVTDIIINKLRCEEKERCLNTNCVLNQSTAKSLKISKKAFEELPIEKNRPELPKLLEELYAKNPKGGLIGKV